MKPREGRWWHQDVSAGEGETPGEPVAWLSLSHGHSHEHRDVTSAATSSTGLSAALWGWFIFSLTDPAAKILKQVRHMGSWHEQTRLAPAQIYKELSYHFIFIFFFFPPFSSNSNQTPNTNYTNQALPGACSCSAKLTFSVSATAGSTNLAAEHRARLEPCFFPQFNKSSASSEHSRLSELSL